VTAFPARASVVVVAADRSSLEVAAPALCTVGSLLALIAALFGSGRTKLGVLSTLLVTIGSVAWLLTALDAQEPTSERDAV
jgi:hypothetical protein